MILARLCLLLLVGGQISCMQKYSRWQYLGSRLVLEIGVELMKLKRGSLMTRFLHYRAANLHLAYAWIALNEAITCYWAPPNDNFGMGQCSCWHPALVWVRPLWRFLLCHLWLFSTRLPSYMLLVDRVSRVYDFKGPLADRAVSMLLRFHHKFLHPSQTFF